MTLRTLLLSVRFHDGHYHGEHRKMPEWPPAPARVFQALVAGTATGRGLLPDEREALEWLEGLDSPVIAAPRAHRGQDFSNFVPNNDHDVVEAGEKQLPKIYVPKTMRPWLFDAAEPVLYLWQFSADRHTSVHVQAKTICKMAEQIHQVGRSIDLAWVEGRISADVSAGMQALAEHEGAVYEPGGTGASTSLLCARKGSLASLQERYRAPRFDRTPEGGTTWRRPREPSFALIRYDCPPSRHLFEIRDAEDLRKFTPWPCTRAVELVTTLRDKATDRLGTRLRGEATKVTRVLIGRGAGEADKALRVRIVPLPSIGHPHADRGIRRVLVEIPPKCPLQASDIAWAFSGIEGNNAENGETGWTLVQSEDDGQLAYYGVKNRGAEGSHRWRTVTPAALPAHAATCRETGPERRAAETGTARNIQAAVRHTGVGTPIASVRVQREPFDRNGARASDFTGTHRFSGPTLHHVEITFARPVHGPLVIGNGRYMGLGLMTPAPSETSRDNEKVRKPKT